ncbi:conserved exported hypothetical protein [Flavobacterium sp. 9R]|uniref:hypothetical protein n=1 Tax=Flavobacterium sp. 9R TaxID=2653143 RepID=UPI0012F1A5AE|nr:hypothetical protein [Flavobacterium sp. 9R]VXB55294.1 conserved exported hypothetical protein [Flavobacterium sp. 9R]
MKSFKIYFLLIFVAFFNATAFAQSNDEPEALGLPGDNLNLYAVLDVFQKSKTLEDFEKAINDEEGKINNLDLNNDNTIDYIQVVSEKKGDSFFVVLQVAVSSSEKQDVAVVEVTKDKKGQVLVQIIGDEELYGKDYIVEPAEVAKVSGTPNPGYKGEGTVIINNNTTNNYNTNSGTTVSAWPVVIYMFSPLFIPWHSPWYWGYYPPYWRPWRPVYYHSYWGYHSHYYGNHYYHRTVIVRNPGHRVYYSNRRTTSVVVRNNRVNGNYRATYDGRTYRKPASPSVRPSTNRPTTRPTTRPTNSNNNMSRPATRPSMPSGNGAKPATRPSVNPRPSTPSTRPSAPVTRPSAPTSRPATRPATRPASGNMSNRGSRN